MCVELFTYQWSSRGTGAPRLRYCRYSCCMAVNQQLPTWDLSPLFLRFLLLSTFPFFFFFFPKVVHSEFEKQTKKKKKEQKKKKRKKMSQLSRSFLIDYCSAVWRRITVFTLVPMILFLCCGVFSLWYDQMMIINQFVMCGCPHWSVSVSRRDLWSRAHRRTSGNLSLRTRHHSSNCVGEQIL